MTTGARVRALWLSLGCVLAAFVPAQAATLTGRVTDASGAAVAGVRVEAGALPGAVTDTQGLWRVDAPGLGDGAVVSVTPSKAGWRFTPVRAQVTVSDGQGAAPTFVGQALLGATPSVGVTGSDVSPVVMGIDTYTTMLRVRLTGQGGSVTVTGLVIRDFGTVAGSSVGIRILRGAADITPVPSPVDLNNKIWVYTFASPIVLGDGQYVDLDLQESGSNAAAGLTARLALATVMTTSPVVGILPTASNGTVVVNGPYLQVTATNSAPAVVNANQWVALLRLRLKAVTGSVTVTRLQVQDIGTIAASNIALRLASGTSVVGTTQSYDAGSKTWTLTLTTPRVLAKDAYIYYDLQVRVAPEALNSTTQLKLTDSSFVSASAPVVGSWPLGSSAAMVVVTPFVDVAATSLAPTRLAANTDATMLRLVLTAGNGPVALNGLRVQDIGTVAPGTQTLRVLIGGAPRSLVAAYDGLSNTWALYFNSALNLAVGQSVTFDVQEQAPAAAAGKTMQLRLTEVSATAPTASGALPFTSGTTTIAWTALTGSSVAPNVSVIGSYTPMLALSFTANGLAGTLSALKVRDTGTVAAANVAATVWRDGANITPAGAAFDSATKTWTFTFSPALTLAAGVAVDLELRARTTAGAAGKTVRFALVDATFVTTNLPLVATFPLTSSASTASQSLQVNGYNVAPAFVGYSTPTALLRVRTQAVNGTVSLTGFKVRETGTAAAGTTSVQVWLSNKVVPTTAVYDQPNRVWTLTFNTPQTLTAGSYRYWELRVVSTVAAVTGTVRLSVVDASYILTSVPVTGTFPMDSGSSTVASLDCSATSLAPTSAIANAATTMLRLTCRANSAAATITGLRVRDTGSAPAAALGLRVKRGAVDLTPTDVGFDAATKTWTVTFTTPVVLGAGQSAAFDLVETAARSAAGQTIRLALEDPSDIVATLPAAGSFPLTSDVAGVLAPVLVVAATDLAPAEALVNAYVPMARIRLTAQAGPVTLVGLKAQDTGSVTATHIGYRLVDSTGAAVPSTTTLDLQTKTWTVTLLTPVTLTAGASVDYTWQVLCGAGGIGSTTRLTLPDAACFQTSVAMPVSITLPFVSGAAQIVPPTLLATASDSAPLAVLVNTYATMLRVTLTAQDGPATVTGLKLKDIGTADGATLLARLVDPATGVPVPVTPSYSPTQSQWTLTLVTPKPLAVGESVEYDIQELGTAAAAGKTIQMSVTDPASVLYSGVARVGGLFPLNSSPTQVTAPSLLVTATDAAPASAMVYAWTTMLNTRLAAQDGPATITGLKVRDLGSAPADALNARLVNRATGQPITATTGYDQQTKVWTFTLANAVNLPAGAAVEYGFQVQGLPGAAGRSAQLVVADGSYVIYSGPLRVTGSFPLNSGVTAITAPALAVQLTDTASASIVVNNQAAMGTLRLTAVDGPATITGLKVRDIGSAPADALALRLVDPASGALVPTSVSYDQSYKLWTLTLVTPVTLAVGGSVEWTLREQPGLGAVDRTMQLTLADTGAVLYRDALRLVGAFPLTTSATTVLAPTLMVNATNTAPTRVMFGTWTSMLWATLTAVDGPATLTGLELRDLGSSPAGALGVRLIDRASGGQLSAATSFDPDRKVWRLTLVTPLNIAAGQSLDLDLQEQGLAGAAERTMQLTLAAPTAVLYNGALRVAGAFPFTSTVTTVYAPTLNVSATSTAPASVIPDTAAAMLALRLATVDAPVQVTGLKVRDVGTAPAGSLGLSLTERVSGAAVPVSTNWDAGSKTWTLAFVTPLNLAAGASFEYLLTEQAGTAAVGQTMQLALTDATSVLYADAVRVLGGFPLLSGLTTVVAPTLSVVLTDAAPAVVMIDNAVTMAHVRLTALDGPAVVTALKVRDSGTAPADSLSVALLDRATGASVPVTTQYDSATKTWTLTLVTPVALAAGGSVEWSLRELAGAGAANQSLRLGLADASFIGYNGALRVVGAFPLASSSTLVTAPTLAVTGTNAAPGAMLTDAYGTLLWVRVTAVDGPARVLGFRVRDLAGSAPADSITLRLIDRANGLPVPTTSAYDAGTRTWTLSFTSPVSLVAGGSFEYGVQALCGPGAVGRSLQLSLEDANAIVLGSTVRLSAVWPLRATAVTVVVPTLAVQGQNIAPLNVIVGAWTGLLDLRLWARWGPATVTSVSVRDIGTVGAAHITARLVNAATGAVVPTNTVYNAGLKIWTMTLSTPLVLSTEALAEYWVQVQVGAGGNGQTTQVTVVDPSWVASTPAATGLFPYSSLATTVVTPALSVRAWNLAPSSVGAGSFVSLLGLALSPQYGAAEVTVIKVRDVGTAPAAAVTARLIDYNTSAAIPASVAYDSGTRTWTFTLTTPLALAEGATAWYAVQEQANSAAIGQTVQAALVDPSYLTASLPASGSFPLQSGPTTVQ